VEPPRDTRSSAYAERLERLAGARWKRWLDVQRPYRFHLRRLALGRTLEIGCGIGRNLAALGPTAVGIDHNTHAIEIARARGFRAWLPDAFRASADAAPPFDALLFAHVLEHMTRADAAALVSQWLQHLRPGGKLLLITPQEAGFRSDASHVEFMDFDALRALLGAVGCEPLRAYSFPFPRVVGHVFPHNEFVVLGHRA
jgi:2-polyprenyl-3-methyl-5-hydroxy-6-metoxy-1,4-benzoquinol methylase